MSAHSNLTFSLDEVATEISDGFCIQTNETLSISLTIFDETFENPESIRDVIILAAKDHLKLPNFAQDLEDIARIKKMAEDIRAIAAELDALAADAETHPKE